jgi:hypothetical protein
MLLAEVLGLIACTISPVYVPVSTNVRSRWRLGYPITVRCVTTFGGGTGLPASRHCSAIRARVSRMSRGETDHRRHAAHS